MNKSDRRDLSRVRTLLDKKESDKLALAVIETGTNKSFLIIKAIEYGLRTLDFPRDAQGKRSYRTTAWVPRTLKNSVNELSTATGLTQQSILRLCLADYLKTAPWKNHDAKNPTPSPERGSQ
ncbi:MAG: hypothetical protein ACLPY5_09865 [Candidatus Bathyarchaeia archaeon]